MPVLGYLGVCPREGPQVFSKTFKGLYNPYSVVTPDEQKDPTHFVLLERLERLRRASVEDMANCGYWWQYMSQSGPFVNWYTRDFTWRQLGQDTWDTFVDRYADC